MVPEGKGGIVAERDDDEIDLPPPMHDDELRIDASLVRTLITRQFPRWKDLPLSRVASPGTVNAIYRLGDDLSVRLPRTARFQDCDTDCWLSALAGRLPLAIPEPMAAGEPDDVYPWRWSIHRWMPGDPWHLARPADQASAARQLVEFVLTLQSVDPSPLGCPPLWDGGSFADQDLRVRQMAERAPGVNSKAVLAAWEEALTAPAPSGPRVLIHWDLLPGNVLVDGGRISAVIDWGALAFGDPSRDLLPAWTLLSGKGRRIFRDGLPSDEATWARARGWTLAFVVGAAYYAATNPSFAAECRATVEAVLEDFATPGP